MTTVGDLSFLRTFRNAQQQAKQKIYVPSQCVLVKRNYLRASPVEQEFMFMKHYAPNRCEPGSGPGGGGSG